MKRGLLALGAVVLVAPLLLAQRPSPSSDSRVPMGRPEDVGMSSERLGRVKAVMQRYVDRREVAGAVTLVARHGRVVHLESVGHRDAEAAAPMTADSIFRLASMTKPIVTVAALMLYEQGEFQLTDPVSKWLPEFQSMQLIQPGAVPGTYTLTIARTPITIKHVMTQTAGLQNSDGVLAAEYQKVAPRSVPNDTLGAFVSRLAAMPLNFEPGTQWHYGPSGTATNVVGRLVEVISKQGLERLLTERIFRPLQMNDTYFYLPEAKLARFTVLYRPGAGNRIEIDERPTTESLYYRERTYFSGSGGLVSTASDYFRFQQMLLNGGEFDGVRLLGRKTVELMTANHTGTLHTATAPGYGFGLGVQVVTDVGATAQLGSIGTYGWGGAQGTIMFNDPVEQIAAAMMIQLRPYAHLNIRRDFRTLTYQALTGPAQPLRSSN
jgi:CubicO group peptidase (beta-lactamase class C family)